MRREERILVCSVVGAWIAFLGWTVTVVDMNSQEAFHFLLSVAGPHALAVPVVIGIVIRRNRRRAKLAALPRPATVRFEFVRSKRMLRTQVLRLALLPVAVACAYALAMLWPRFGLFFTSFVVVLLVPAMIITGDTLPRLLRLSRLTIGPLGIQLHRPRETIIFAWSDIESWWIGIPSGATARLVGRHSLLARPAAHVHDPTHGTRRPLWSPPDEAWRICDPQLTDGTPEELAAAIDRFSPGHRQQEQIRGVSDGSTR